MNRYIAGFGRLLPSGFFHCNCTILNITAESIEAARIQASAYAEERGWLVAAVEAASPEGMIPQW